MESSHVISSPSIRVLVVDDHPAVRQGLAFMLASDGIEVCAEAGRRSDALARIAERRPDVAVVDLSLEDEDGGPLIADLQQRGVPVLVYSMHSDAAHVIAAFAAGALGYVTKREFKAAIVQAIREVARGRRFASPVAAAALAEGLTTAAAEDVLQKLSAHERKVYELIGRGQDTFDIAAALHVSNHTVESYYERIKIKLSLNSMYELRRQAIDRFQKHTP